MGGSRRRAAVGIGAATMAMALLASTSAGPGSPVAATDDRPSNTLVTNKVAPLDIEPGLARAAEVLNFYREGTGLPPVATDEALSLGARDHSCWMAENDVLDHYREGASTGASGARSNIAVGRSRLYSDKRFVELWLTGPYHAISMMRWGLHTIGYGTCTDEAGTWRKAATMDVVNGYERRRTEAPVLFPPPGHTTDLYRFLTEEPNPLENCGWESAGLPVFAMMPEPPTAATTASLRGPDGEVEVCLVTARNDVTEGRAVLQFDNAVLVIPKDHLDQGQWDVMIDTGRRRVDWSFHVGEHPSTSPPSPPLPVTSAMPATSPVGAPSRLVTTAVERTVDTRVLPGPPQLAPGIEYRIPIGAAPMVEGRSPAASAVALTVTAVGHVDPGWAAVYPCAAGYTGTSTVNFVPGATAANSAIVPLMDATAVGGVPVELCARVSSPTDLIVDVSGWFVDDPAAAGFVAAEKRLLDSRGREQPFVEGETFEVKVAEPGTVAVALNITTAITDSDGYLTVWPCDRPRSETSVSQPTVGLVRATATIVPVSADGTVCIFTSAQTQVIVDRQGIFVHDGGADFVPLLPVRAIDTRSGPHPWSEVARRFDGPSDVEREVVWSLPGLPAGTTALALNITSVGGSRLGWLAASGCERYAGQSSLNFTEEMAVPNQLVVDADGGRSCLRVDGFTHVIADVAGAFVDR